jgi:hypothetical protein
MEVQMAKKKNQLASGSIRVQRRYKGDDGKTHTKSFTARSRAEAEAMAAEWLAHRSQVVDKITVAGAVEKYIEMKKAVLSPSTIRSYLGMHRKYLSGPFGQTQLLDVTNLDIQLWVSQISADASPKTVRNVFGLVSATLSMFMPDFTVHATLPAKVKPDLYCPSTADIRAVLAATDDLQIKAAILLAAVGTMRQGEICALKWDDINGRTLNVRSSMVKDVDGTWSIKAPKTLSSNRSIPMTKEVMQLLHALPKNRDGRVLSYNPQQVGHRFQTAVRHAGVHWFRFHDLRHYSASQMHLSGIPDKYIEARGGWRDGSSVMKRTYQTVIDIEKARQDKKILGVFKNMII